MRHTLVVTPPPVPVCCSGCPGEALLQPSPGALSSVSLPVSSGSLPSSGSVLSVSAPVPSNLAPWRITHTYPLPGPSPLSPSFPVKYPQYSVQAFPATDCFLAPLSDVFSCARGLPIRPWAPPDCNVTGSRPPEPARRR
ncbi:hypothetical protein Holit_01152 [Hollandina sp. SP2]